MLVFRIQLPVFISCNLLTNLLVQYSGIAALDVVVHRGVVVRLNDPQSLALVDPVWRRYVIFEVLLAIGAFSGIQLASPSLIGTEISV